MAQWIAEDAAPSAAPMAAPNPTAWQAEEPTSWLTTADDTVRAVANSATFGMADRFAGAMEGLTSGQGYRAGVDAEVAKTAAARERSPVATTVGDITGALAIPGFGAARLAARYGGGLLARAGAYGGTGRNLGAARRRRRCRLRPRPAGVPRRGARPERAVRCQKRRLRCPGQQRSTV
jgi:hypothetical protein